MATSKVILKHSPVLEKDPVSNHVRFRATLDSMANELQELRGFESANEALRAENAGLRQALATLEAMATYKTASQSVAQIPTTNNPQIGDGQ